MSEQKGENRWTDILLARRLFEIMLGPDKPSPADKFIQPC